MPEITPPEGASFLTPRYYALRKHAVQIAWMKSEARFNMVPAGRRSGKTERAKRKLIRRAFEGTEFPDARFFAGAPTRQQAKDIYWQDLKAMIPRWALAARPSETELSIHLINGSEIRVVGLDKPERIEGVPWDGGVLDEYGNMKKQAWTSNIRPALSDRLGWCDLIGVPEGRNHYYDLHQKALEMISSGSKEFGVFHWKSSDILPASEIRSARLSMDQLTFEQEYEASFVNFVGRVYYPFNRLQHVSKDVVYHTGRPIIFCFDFNVSPGTCVIAQEQPKLPNGETGTAIIGEVHIPQNSTTVSVCRKLIQVWGNHKAGVHCYGDATGGSPGSAKVEGSDWDLIRRELRPAFKESLKFFVLAGNGPERTRVNAMNTRLMAGFKGPEDDPIIRMMVHPKCENVIKDFEGVRLLEGGSGEIDKDADKALSHLTDGLGYYIVQKHPIVKGIPQREF